MRVLVIIIAILALLGGLANFFGGLLGFYSGLLMMTAPFPTEVAQASEMSPLQIGMVLLLVGFLMVINGLLFVVFAIGAFGRKRWARFLGIFAYALNIVVFFITLLTPAARQSQESLFPYIFGTFVAVAFIIVLIFAKSAFEKPSPALAAKGV